MGRHLDTGLFREARNASGSTDRVRELIAAGADVNRRHKCGNTPLWEAAYHGRQDIVAILLAANADAAVYADDGSGPLHWAAHNGHLEIVKTLLACGADPNALRDSGLSVLAGAVSNGDAKIVEVLVAAGAAVDHRYFDRSMAEYADWCKQPKIAAFLRQSESRRRTKRCT